MAQRRRRNSLPSCHAMDPFSNDKAHINYSSKQPSLSMPGQPASAAAAAVGTAPLPPPGAPSGLPAAAPAPPPPLPPLRRYQRDMLRLAAEHDVIVYLETGKQRDMRCAVGLDSYGAGNGVGRRPDTLGAGRCLWASRVAGGLVTARSVNDGHKALL